VGAGLGSTTFEDMGTLGAEFVIAREAQHLGVVFSAAGLCVSVCALQHFPYGHSLASLFQLPNLTHALPYFCLSAVLSGSVALVVLSALLNNTLGAFVPGRHYPLYWWR
jgi:hypothetical protein